MCHDKIVYSGGAHMRNTQKARGKKRGSRKKRPYFPPTNFEEGSFEALVAWRNPTVPALVLLPAPLPAPPLPAQPLPEPLCNIEATEATGENPTDPETRA